MQVKSYLITLVVFFVIDIIWLAVIAKSFYKEQLGFIMAKKPNWYAAIAFYLIFIFGLTYFVVNPAVAEVSLRQVVIGGLLFGFVTYSTYDLTNLATLKDWPLKITVIDLIWGTALGGSVSTISYLIQTKV